MENASFAEKLLKVCGVKAGMRRVIYGLAKGRFFLFFAIWPLAYSCFAENIKPPNVAGSFYPDDPKQLSSMIDAFFNSASEQGMDADIFVLISPHAGYVYSGATAAYGYKAISNREYDTVVIIAPSHSLSFEGFAIWPQGSFRTPLGSIAVDQEFSRQLMQINPRVSSIPQAFSKEHSLEVQLPFLQKALKGFRIVPLITGRVDFGDCQLLAHSLSILSKKKKCLLVVSTDLSHYHTLEEANRIDQLTISHIRNLNSHGLYVAAEAGKVEACGLYALVTGILYSRELEAGKVSIFKYANSGDISGDYKRVVGYVSAAIYKEENAAKTEKGRMAMLGEKQKKRLLEIARNSIGAYLKSGRRLELTEKDEQLLQEGGAFVTLHEGGELRGCIGNLMGTGPLYLTVRDMAVEAAVGDPRFEPLREAELPKVEIEISVLSPMQRVGSADEIKLGIHGVLIKNGPRSGVFLPQVATETGWSKEEFLSTLCSQKAGLPPDAWKSKDTQIYVFTAEVFSEPGLKSDE